MCLVYFVILYVVNVFFLIDVIVFWDVLFWIFVVYYLDKLFLIYYKWDIKIYE